MKDHLHFLLFVVICTLWTGIFFILPYFHDNPVNNFTALLEVVVYWGLTCLASFLIIMVAASSKYVFAFFFPIFSFLGALLGFFRYFYAATLTPMLIEASLHNDLGTSADLISWWLIAFIVLNLVFAGFMIGWRWKKITIKKVWIYTVLAAAFFILMYHFNGRLQRGLNERFPVNVYHNFRLYNQYRVAISAERINPSQSVVRISNDSLTVVFVLGETLRADHLSLNGYERETTPLLAKRNNLISFPYIYSPYTHTNPSLPYILTRADSLSPERAYNETSFIPLFRQCGFYSAWIGNQDPGNTYISLIYECDTVLFAHPEKTSFVYQMWLDEDLLPITEALQNVSNPNKLLILHTIGGHWYYNNHVSPECTQFIPTTKTRVLSQCSKEELINSYDNTAVYADYFLNKLLDLFENENAMVIYLSDHGESLGEDGHWLHANDAPAEQNPACIVWFSEEYKARYPDFFEAMEKNKNKRFGTEFLYHSILRAANIQTDVYENSLDIFSICLPTLNN